MTPADVIAARSAEWRQLEQDIAWLRGVRGRRLDAARVAAFARRYRAACSDLGLAIGMRFPAPTTDYLQQLVADAHTQLYRIESFSMLAWLRSLLVDVPRRTITDPCTWIAAVIFAATFLGSQAAAVLQPGFAAAVVGEGALSQCESMYADKPTSGGFTEERTAMAGFYVFNNAGIGVRCFAGGILGGLGSLVVLGFNGIFLGTVFGHMLASTARDNFVEFVTAHAPFELTAVVLSAAAGLRLGWALLDTRGWSRWESLRRSARDALGTLGLATVLFFLAAFIEGYVSPAPLPYAVKAAVATGSGLVLVGYFMAFGTRGCRGRMDAA